MKVTIPKQLKEKMLLLCKYAMKEVSLVCKSADVGKEEKQLFNKYLKGLLTLSGGITVEDLPNIGKLVKNQNFRRYLAGSQDLYPFLGDAVGALSIAAFLYNELQSKRIWEEDSDTWKFLNSSDTDFSLSCVTALLDYIKATAPTGEELTKYEEDHTVILERAEDTISYKVNPVAERFQLLEAWEEGFKTRAQKHDFVVFARVVMLCTPEDKASLYEIKGLKFAEEEPQKFEDIIAGAELFGKQYRGYFPEKKFSLPGAEEAPTAAPTHIKVVYDILNAVSTPTQIYDKELQEGEANFANLRIVQYLMQQNGALSLLSGQNGFAKAFFAMLILASGHHDLVALNPEGSEFETTFYKLYKLISKETDPNEEEMTQFVAGFRLLTIPQMLRVKGTDITGKAAEVSQQFTLVHVKGTMLISKILSKQATREKKSSDDWTIFSQKIRFELDPVYFTGFKETIIEKRDGREEVVFSPYPNKRPLLLPNKSVNNGVTQQWVTFVSIVKTRGTKTKKGHMKESDILSLVFEYENLLELARFKDERGEECDRTEKRRDKVYKFPDWESWQARDIKLHEHGNKKTLAKYFERAKQENIIVSYKYKTNTKTYEWQLLEVPEEQGE